MKVLHVIPSVSSVRGGPSQAVLEMVSALRSQGVTAEIVTTNDNGNELLEVLLNRWIDYPVDLSANLKFIPKNSSETSSFSHSETVPVQFFARFSPPLNSIREFAFSLSLTQWLWQHLADYDLVHIHAIFSYPSTVAMAIARLQKIPYIVRPLGQLCHWSLQQGSFKKQVYLRLVERANLEGSHAIHYTAAQEQAEAATLALATESFILPHGLKAGFPIADARQRLRQQFQLPVDEPIILFLSRLHPKKGLDRLIAGLSEVKTHRFTLLIAGTGDPDYETEIDRHLQITGLNHRTQRVGFVSGEMKQILLQGSDLFALTSQSENFGIAVLEALAAGLPVLITPEIALAPLVERYCLGWVSSAEPQAIATAFQQFLHNPRAAQSMGDRARQIAQEQFAWSQIAADLSQRYQGILNQRSSLSYSATSHPATSYSGMIHF